MRDMDMSVQLTAVNYSLLEPCRQLQSSNPQFSPTPTLDLAQVLGFVAFNLFWVICFMSFMWCACRRHLRMMNDVQLLQPTQNHNHRQTHLFLTDFSLPPRMEEEQKEANQISIQVQEALQTTTMLVDQNDLVRRSNEDDSHKVPAETSIQVEEKEIHQEEEKETHQEEEKESEEKETTSVHDKIGGDVEMGELLPSFAEEDEFYYLVVEEDGAEREFSHLQLPQNTTNGARLVPAGCSICLCPYEAGEHVSWSPELACQHAFHRDCITSWLSKKCQHHLCPCCRQEFIHLDEPTTPEENNVIIVAVRNEEGLPFGALYPPAIMPTNVRGVSSHHHLNV